VVLFSIKGKELKKIHQIDFKLEKDIQKITETNIGEIFGLEFVKSEFQLMIYGWTPWHLIGKPNPS